MGVGGGEGSNQNKQEKVKIPFNPLSVHLKQLYLRDLHCFRRFYLLCHPQGGTTFWRLGYRPARRDPTSRPGQHHGPPQQAHTWLPEGEKARAAFPGCTQGERLPDRAAPLLPWSAACTRG